MKDALTVYVVIAACLVIWAWYAVVKSDQDESDIGTFPIPKNER